jgi:hypothetical protein
MTKSDALREAQKKYYFKIKGTDKYKQQLKIAQKKYYLKNKDGLIKDYTKQEKHCDVCDKSFHYNYWYLHKNTKKHLQNIEAKDTKERLLKVENRPIELKKNLLDFFVQNSNILDQLLSHL